jgi:hypothetical protein
MEDLLGEKLKEQGIIEETNSFNVKYNLNDENISIHVRFKEFARENAKNNYLNAIDMLMESWDGRARYELLMTEIESLRSRVASLETRADPPKEKAVRTFGG